MARVIGRPGYWSYFDAVGNLVLGVIVSAVLAGGLAWAFGTQGWGGVGIAVLIWATEAYIFRRWTSDVLRDLRRAPDWFRGARGESATARELDRLSNKYVVFHDLHPREGESAQMADWNIDHVVVGPNGVFAVDSKNPRRRTMVVPAGVSEFTTADVQSAERGAQRLKERLVVWSKEELAGLDVKAVVVYANDADVAQTLEGRTLVVPRRWVRSRIEAAGARFQMTPSIRRKIVTAIFGQYSARSHRRFAEAYQQAMAELRTPECPACGAPMRLIDGKYGRFWGCVDYRTRNCRGKLPFDEESSV